MNIIIVGCGQVGSTLAEQLNEENHNITVVDTDMNALRSVTGRLDIMGVCGNGATHTTLKDAGLGHADLLIAVTPSDELNILCCIVAKKARGCRTIARVRDHQYYKDATFLKDELGLAMVINPELASAEEISRVLRFPSAISIETFGKGRVELIKFRLSENSKIVGRTVKDIMQNDKLGVVFCTVERKDGTHIVNGKFVFQPKDVISIVSSSENAAKFFKKIGHASGAVRDVTIVGGGEVTHYLCGILRRSVEVKIIDDDREVCEELASSFPNATVINLDTSDQDNLREEGVDTAGAFLALTDSDEENIILSLYGRTHTSGKVVTKISRLDFSDVLCRLELDTVIYPKNIVANSIARYVRAMKNTRGSNMETLYSIIPGEVEAAEFVVSDKSSVTGKHIMDLNLKPDIVIAAIVRNDEVIFPRGADTIEIGDAVIVVSRDMALKNITDIILPGRKPVN